MADKDLLTKNLPKKSKDLDTVLEQGLLPEEVQTAREIVDGFDGAALDKYNDGLIYRAYHAARTCRNPNPGVIAKMLGISRKLLEYYLEKYPKLGIAIQAGYMDSADTMKHELMDALYSVAMGYKYTDVTVHQEDVLDDFGEVIASKKNTTTAYKNVPPNVQAILELMRRLDPSWVPKVEVDVQQNINQTFHVAQDISVQVDYRKLSPEALRELLQANKDPNCTQNLNDTEDGQSVRVQNKTCLAERRQRRLDSGKKPVKAPKNTTRNKAETDKLLELKKSNMVKTRVTKTKSVANNTKKGEIVNEKRKRGRPKKIKDAE